MCCEECPEYEQCEEHNYLKDNCCLKCPEYYSCVGADDVKKNSSGDSCRDDDQENYL